MPEWKDDCISLQVHKKYTLRVFSNKPITFEALPPKPKSKPRR